MCVFTTALQFHNIQVQETSKEQKALHDETAQNVKTLLEQRTKTERSGLPGLATSVKTSAGVWEVVLVQNDDQSEWFSMLRGVAAVT